MTGCWWCRFKRWFRKRLGKKDEAHVVMTIKVPDNIVIKEVSLWVDGDTAFATWSEMPKDEVKATMFTTKVNV